MPNDFNDGIDCTVNVRNIPAASTTIINAIIIRERLKALSVFMSLDEKIFRVVFTLVVNEVVSASCIINSLIMALKVSRYMLLNAKYFQLHPLLMVITAHNVNPRNISDRHEYSTTII